MCEYVEYLGSLEKISENIEKDTVKRNSFFASWKDYFLSIRNILVFQAGSLTIIVFSGS